MAKSYLHRYPLYLCLIKSMEDIVVFLKKNLVLTISSIVPGKKSPIQGEIMDTSLMIDKTKL